MTTALEEETLGYSDEAHLQYAAERGWRVLTFDDDFLSLAETELADIHHAGIVFTSQYGRDIGELVGRLDSTLQQHGDRDLTDEMIYEHRRLEKHSGPGREQYLERGKRESSAAGQRAG